MREIEGRGRPEGTTEGAKEEGEEEGAAGQYTSERALSDARSKDHDSPFTTSPSRGNEQLPLDGEGEASAGGEGRRSKDLMSFIASERIAARMGGCDDDLLLSFSSSGSREGLLLKEMSG
jgi:hypothetical protein